MYDVSNGDDAMKPVGTFHNKCLTPVNAKII